MPGDDFLPSPDMLSTRATTIDAPASAVWPWLVQMGSGRAGAYTYDWAENLLGLDMHSADEILPQFQDLKVGDVLPVGFDGPAHAGGDPGAGSRARLEVGRRELGVGVRPLHRRVR